jgi:hypothetical protein
VEISPKSCGNLSQILRESCVFLARVQNAPYIVVFGTHSDRDLPKRSRNPAKILRKSRPNPVEISPKSCGNLAQILWKSRPNAVEISPKSCGNLAKLLRKSHPNPAEISPRCCPDSAQNQPRGRLATGLLRYGS